MNAKIYSLIILTVFNLTTTLILSAQNLVPNPSFESNSGCPTSISQLYLANFWSSPTAATPDYIHTCGTGTWVTVPNPFGGYQQPRTGNAYAHIISYPDIGAANYREYLQVQLTSPLITGQTYEVSFYASLNNSSRYAINNLGAYLSSTPPSSSNTLVLPITPQIVETNIISDTTNWVQISGLYTATGGEQYLTIGNFFDDASTNTIVNTGTTSLVSDVGYLIDDVSVLPYMPPTSLCDTNCSPNLAPNPGFEATTVNCADTISEIFTNYTQVQGWYGIACDTCPSSGTTPDYYNSNCNGPSQTLTCDGSNGSIGFFTYLISGTNSREYVQAQLNTPLVAGQEYCVSVQVRTPPGVYKPSDGFGMWFTNQMVDIDVQNGGQYYLGPGSMVNATPQIENPSGNFIDNNCQTISGTFIANGTEQWVVIGNFKNDANTNFSTGCSFFSPCIGYLVIDNISIRAACSTTPTPPTIALTLSNDTICENSCTQISATTSGSNTPLTITWNNGLPNGSGPHTVCPANTTIYEAIVTDALGNTDTATVTLHVLNTYHDTVNLSICNGDSVYLQGAWQSTQGIYNDTLNTVFGCDSIISTQLSILPTSSSNINYSLCSGDSIYLNGSWQTTSGTYYDTLSNSLGCDSIIIANVQFTNTIINNNNLSICQGDSILINGIYYNNNVTLYDTASSSSGCDSVTITNLNVIPSQIYTDSIFICNGDSIQIFGTWQNTAGTYTDTLTAFNGCDSILIVHLSLTSKPNAIITGNDTICYGESTTLTASGGNSYVWSTGDSSSSVSVTPLTNTNYSVVVFNNSCTDTAQITVYVNSLPNINAGQNITINYGQSATLTATGTNGTYIWTPDDWLTCNVCPVTVSTPEETTTYYVSVVDSNGCIASDSIIVYVNYENVVWVPNVFSPNDDGVNDILYVRGKSIESFELVIYDRWGEKVFYTNKLDIGWDGTFRGKKMNKAVFVYYLKGFFKDGSAFSQKGDITLIR
jgi:gliding motility-associated-like protein